MTPEEAIQVADAVLIAHTGKPLTDIQRMILCESIAGKSYESMTGYASQHIKNEGKKLWDLLSDALKEPGRNSSARRVPEAKRRIS